MTLPNCPTLKSQWVPAVGSQLGWFSLSEGNYHRANQLRTSSRVRTPSSWGSECKSPVEAQVPREEVLSCTPHCEI